MFTTIVTVALTRSVKLSKKWSFYRLVLTQKIWRKVLRINGDGNGFLRLTKMYYICIFKENQCLNTYNLTSNFLFNYLWIFVKHQYLNAQRSSFAGNVHLKLYCNSVLKIIHFCYVKVSKFMSFRGPSAPWTHRGP